jgi:hypothetical protein
MNTPYRIDIAREGRLWGQLHIDHPWGDEALRDLLNTLKAHGGYELSVHVAKAERRIIESSPAGVRVLGREPLFEPMPAHLLEE